ncbi:MAG: hypothetical protein K2X87_00940 [Gemmataceae bacterium]|nr:hypothetical protein [Gemmataceae bacterium]
MAQCILTLLLTWGVTAVAPVPPGRLQSPWYYPLKVGAEWVYLRGDEEARVVVAAVAKKGAAFEVTAEELLDDGTRRPWERVAVSEGGLAVLHDGGFEHQPPVPWLRAPHRAGDRWRVDTSFDSGGGGTPFPLFAAMVVVGEEEVRVPAGVYRAIRVRARHTGWRQGAEERWYAPGVGLVKKTDPWGGSLELKAFRPAK